MTWLLYNIPLMILFFALWVGIPLWLVTPAPGHRPPGSPDGRHRLLARSSTTTPATRALPDPGRGPAREQLGSAEGKIGAAFWAAPIYCRIGPGLRGTERDLGIPWRGLVQQGLRPAAQVLVEEGPDVDAGDVQEPGSGDAGADVDPELIGQEPLGR